MSTSRFSDGNKLIPSYDRTQCKNDYCREVDIRNGNCIGRSSEEVDVNNVSISTTRFAHDYLCMATQGKQFNSPTRADLYGLRGHYGQDTISMYECGLQAESIV